MTSLVLVVLLTACAGSGEPGDAPTEKDATAQADTTSPPVASADTVFADSTFTDTLSSGETSQDRPVGDPLTPRPAPPPGTVEVRARVERCTSGASGMQCTLTIQAVLRTGMSTPPMAPGSRTVQVAPHVVKAYPVDTLSQQTPREFRLSAPSESLGDASTTSMWTLVRVL